MSMRSVAARALVARRGLASAAPAATAKEVLTKAAQPTLSELKNGLRVVSEDNGRAIATVGVWVENGARFEDASNNGISHFLERILYKGTSKRSQGQLESELAAIGARLNSTVARDHTALYIQAHAKDLDKVFPILADVLLNEQFTGEAVERERATILKEIDEAETNYEQLSQDYLHFTAFNGNGLANPILGRTDAVQRITADSLRQWKQDHFRPTRIAVSAVGGVQHDKLTALAEQYLGGLSNSYPRKVPVADGARFIAGEFDYHNDAIPLLYESAAAPGVAYGHPNALALDLIAELLGSWDRTVGVHHYNSPNKLVLELLAGHAKISGEARDEIQAWRAFHHKYKDTGLFGLTFVAKGNFQANVEHIRQVLQGVWTDAATTLKDSEVERARNQLFVRLFSAYSCNTERAGALAKEALFTGSVASLADVEKQLSSLSVDRVRNAALQQIYDRELAICHVGRSGAGVPQDWWHSGQYKWRF